MESLFSQLSFLAKQVLDNKGNFDTAEIDDLLALFEQEAYGSWAAAPSEHRKAAADAEVSFRAAEDYLDSLMEAAMADFRSSCEAVDRIAAVELSGLERAADATQKVGEALGDAGAGASKKYTDAAAAAASAMATMKSTFASSKIGRRRRAVE